MDTNDSEHNQTLVSEVAANSTFKSLLRTGNKTEQLYRENKLLYPTKDFSQLPQNLFSGSHKQQGYPSPTALCGHGSAPAQPADARSADTLFPYLHPF